MSAARNAPKVHIGIVTYNSELDLDHCIRSVDALTYPNLEVTFLDNASADGTLAKLHDGCAQHSILANSVNVGYGRAHNQILEHIHLGSDDFYLALNPDTVLEHDYVSALVEALNSTGCGWGVGKLKRMDRTGQALGDLYSAGLWVRRDGLVINRGQGLADCPEFNVQQEVFCASGTAMLLQARLIADIAPDKVLFDPDMFMYAEDVDMGWRARLQGWRCVYAPQASALHRGGMPGATLRLEALTNNYLAVLKNAFLADLITCNLPLIAANCLVRILVSPRRGIRLTLNLLRLGPRSVRKRKPTRVRRSDLVAWFETSTRQPTSQPTTLIERVKVYFSQ